MSNNISNEYLSVKNITYTITKRGKGVNYKENIITYNDFIYELGCPNPSCSTNTNKTTGFQFRNLLDKVIKQKQTSTTFQVDCDGIETPLIEDIPELPCSNTIKVDVVIEYQE